MWTGQEIAGPRRNNRRDRQGRHAQIKVEYEVDAAPGPAEEDLAKAGARVKAAGEQTKGDRG